MRLIAPVILLALALVAVVALDRPRPRADFVVANSVDAFTLDPQRMSYQHDIRFARALYEMLVEVADDGSLVPAAASSWEQSADGLIWTFHLRPESKWSNGDPVRASDFVYAWRRLLLPESAADYTGFLFSVDGAEAFFEWRANALAAYARGERAPAVAAPAVSSGSAGPPAGSSSPAPPVGSSSAGPPAASPGTREAAQALWRETLERFDRTVGISAPDDHTLVVRLARPVHFWLDLCAFPALGPVHPPTVERYTSLDPATGRLVQKPGWTKAGELVSNGPYQLVEWRYKRNLRIERNPHFRDQSMAISDSIDSIPIESPTTAVLSYESGAADWLPDLLVDYRAEMVESGRKDVHAIPAFGTDFFSFNCRPTLSGGRPNPFADARVRRAFALAVDRQLLVDRVTRLHEPVSNVLVPRGSIPGYESPAGLPFDPSRAREELAAAGWSDRNGDGFVEDSNGRPFPTVDLLFSSTSPRYRDLSLALRDLWRTHLGVNVETRGKDSKLYKEDLKVGNFMVARGGWYGDYHDPTTWLELSRTGDGNNDRGYSNPAFDALLAQAANERDPARRFTILTEAERVLCDEDLPILPLCTFLTLYLYDPAKVSGLSHHPGLDQYLGRVRVRQ